MRTDSVTPGSTTTETNLYANDPRTWNCVNVASRIRPACCYLCQFSLSLTCGMSQKKLVRGCVAGLIFACALLGAPSIAVKADTVITTIRVGTDPYAVAINPSGTFAYVTNNGGPVNSGNVSKINLINDSVSTITVGSGPIGVAINPVGTFAYVTNSNSGNVSKIDLATDSVVNTISVGSGPNAVAINSPGTFAYVTNSNSGTVSKIDLATDLVAKTISVGSLPAGVAINPAGTFAYVWRSGWSTVQKIDLHTDLVATISFESGVYGMAINPAGTFAYVSVAVGSTTGNVLKIDLTTDLIVATILVGGLPRSVTINSAGTFAYVANNMSSNVSKIDLATDSVKATIRVGSGPFGAAINPAGTLAYVTHNSSGTVSKVALTATDPQSITFTAVGTQYLSAKTVALSAAASSTLAVALTSATSTVCTVSGSTVTLATIGDCTINANQAGGSGFDAAPQVSQTFTVLPTPAVPPSAPAGEVGVSINSGDIYTNTSSVKLDLVWPEFATGALISNDGGFLASKTSTIQLAASVDWTLATSGLERLPKIVYVRFIKSKGDAATFTDDIILDMTPPALTDATAVASSSAAGAVSVLSVGAKSKSGVKLLVKASDANSGIGWIEVRTSSNSVATKIRYTKPKNKSQTFNLKTTSKSVQVRVMDLAGNTSKWKTVKVR